jgi:putative MATE family efflux protein
MPSPSIAERPATAPDAPSLRADLVGAIRGSHRVDYTAGPIGRAIMLLAVPMVLEMAMESIFAVVDVFFVGRLGANAVATVGLTESLLTILYALAMGLGIGVTAMVSRRTGERDPDGAARAAVQALALGLAIAITIGIGGAVYAPRLLSLMGASPTVIETGAGYARVMIGGNATILLLFLANAVFRGAGDAHVAMRVLWIANGINIVLDPLLIFGIGPFPDLGVTGAAVATTIGRGTGVLIALAWLTRENGRISIARRHLRIEPAIMARITRLSLAGTLQVFIGMVSWIGLVRVLSSFGSEAVAGYTIAVRIILFALLPSWGMSNAAATMVGQALGAQKPDRAERAVWRAAFYNVCFLGLVGIVFVVAARPLVDIFTDDRLVLGYGTTGLRTVASGFLFYAYGMVLTQSFNGAGDTWTPTLINFFIFWLWEIPLAILLALVFDLGPFGVFIAMTVAFSSLAVVSALLFRRGRWKLRVV